MKRFLFWLVFNVPLGRLTPWVLGLALGAVPRRVKEADLNPIEQSNPPDNYIGEEPIARGAPFDEPREG